MIYKVVGINSDLYSLWSKHYDTDVYRYIGKFCSQKEAIDEVLARRLSPGNGLTKDWVLKHELVIAP